MTTESMVERLAKKWSSETGEHHEEPVLASDARWWLNALADEHEAEVERLEHALIVVGFEHSEEREAASRDLARHRWAERWLREEAS